MLHKHNNSLQSAAATDLAQAFFCLPKSGTLRRGEEDQWQTCPYLPPYLIEGRQQPFYRLFVDPLRTMLPSFLANYCSLFSEQSSDTEQAEAENAFCLSILLLCRV